MSEPITNVEDAVAKLGALPVPAGPVPQGSELETLRARVAELEAERHVTNEALSDAAVRMRADQGRIAELEAQRTADHVTWQHDLRTARAEREATAARIAELEALTPAAIQSCRKCGAGYTYGGPCSTCMFRERMAAETQALSARDEFHLRHSYRVGRDLPERDDPARCLKVHPFSPRDGWRMVCGSCDHGRDADCHQTDGALTPGACKACGSAPDSWCPDCAACQRGCYDAFVDNLCTHANASWVGVE